ncbi:MAG: hypothetical protein EOO88_23985 [Pedobacter sp.]|nr:MAG: hypothetical protein EOO88_23985 [Pedobacter sp.]
MNYQCFSCNNVVQGKNLVLAHVRSIGYMDEFSESASFSVDGQLRIEHLSAYLLRFRLPDEIRVEVIFDQPFPGTSGTFEIKSYIYYLGIAKLAVYCSVCKNLHHLTLYHG